MTFRSRVVARLAGLLLVCATACIGPAAAQPGTPDSLATVPPDRIVRGSIDRLTGFVLGSAEVSPESLGAFLELEMGPLLDLDYMAEWAAGRYWRRLDEAGREQLKRTLERMLVAGLGRNLGAYEQPLPRIEVWPARRTGAGEVSVQLMVTGEHRQSVVDFRLYRGHAGWKIFDVAADGNSALAYYRTYFARLLRRKGPAALAP